MRHSRIYRAKVGGKYIYGLLERLLDDIRAVWSGDARMVLRHVCADIPSECGCRVNWTSWVTAQDIPNRIAVAAISFA